MGAKFSSDGTLKDLINQMDQLKEVPLKTIFKLEMALGQGFAMTQTNVHVITSSLKWSGDSSSDYDNTSGEWTGEISYGGPSMGIHNPVEYAMYEQQRGGAHDFMASLEMTSDEMDIIVEDLWDDA